jgi:hypothetical protein
MMKIVMKRITYIMEITFEDALQIINHNIHYKVLNASFLYEVCNCYYSIFKDEIIIKQDSVDLFIKITKESIPRYWDIQFKILTPVNLVRLMKIIKRKYIDLHREIHLFFHDLKYQINDSTLETIFQYFLLIDYFSFTN